MFRIFVFLSGVAGLIFASCQISPKSIQKTMIIGPETLPCSAGAAKLECMQVKWSKDQADWENFYGQIEGFEFEKGYEYELLVREKKIANPPADAPGIKYALVKTVSKTKAETPMTAFADNSKSALDWTGTYQGILPCADCEGIKTTIVLRADETYQSTLEYMGKSAKPLVESGKFAWNPEGSKITLLGAAEKQQYLVGENQLFHLDNAGNRIEGNLADKYILAKTNDETGTANTGFEDKKWVLISFLGKEIKGDEGEYFIAFDSKTKRMSAKVGCNALSAGYELAQELKLKIGPIISTKMACPDGIEDEFVRNLQTVNNVTTNGEQLQLNRARMNIATYRLIR